MTQGSVHYFEQVDNLSGAAVYRMRILEVSNGRLVFEIENSTSIRRFLVTIFQPGEMQAVYFLDREPAGVWRYYALLRTGRNANRLAAGHPSSSINRANAFYRWLAGIPTDQERQRRVEDDSMLTHEAVTESPGDCRGGFGSHSRGGGPSLRPGCDPC